jgi:hypothetical protein
MQGTEWLAAIAALERTLARRLPERSAQWGALLNALAAQVEPPGANAGVVDHVVGALHALLDGCGVDPRQGDVDKKLDALAHARPAWPAPPAPTDDDPEPMPAFSLGPNAIAEVTYLRYQLGMSVAYVHRHLSHHVGVRMPAEDLLRCVAGATPPSRRATRR